jgi:hypothetical protein
VVKTLSGANQTNIAAAFLDPDILVEMPNLSKQWSTKTRASYETRIVAISPLRQAIDPRGGVAEQRSRSNRKPPPSSFRTRTSITSPLTSTCNSVPTPRSRSSRGSWIDGSMPGDF